MASVRNWGLQNVKFLYLYIIIHLPLYRIKFVV